MTSTSFNIGLNTASRNSSKVLKPPGGGSSDIFGSAEPVEPQRKAKTHLTSSIFAEESAPPSRNKAGNSSFYNLFGNEPQNNTVTDSSAHKSKSNINTFEPDHTANYSNEETSTDKEISENGNLVESNGNGLSSNASDCTSEKAETPSVMNGTASSTTSTASSAVPTPTNAAPAAGRQRIPPGGFSSGLW